VSIRAREWVWEHSKAEGTDLLLMLAIAEHTRDDPRVGAWPSQERLAKKIRKTARQVRRITDKLEGWGELTVVPNGGPQRGEGRPPHLYHLPGLIAAAELPDTQTSGNSDRQAPELPDISGELPDIAMTELPDTAMSGEEKEPREEEGEARERDPSPPSPEAFPDNCDEHRHDPHPPKCWACKRTREANERRRAGQPQQPTRSPWCGHCDESTRQLDTEPVTRCPRCHPLAIGVQP
jgi:helix-turn-helix protein